MEAPVLTKILDSKDTYIERMMPAPGEINVTQGSRVEPFDHLGICTYSQKTLKLPSKFRPTGYRKVGQFYYVNSILGKKGREVITAPYNGNLQKMPNGSYEFYEEPSKYLLLSGTWGVVDKITENKSVLIKSHTKDLNLAVATKTSFAGELVVFPNPSHLLEKFYLEGFASGTADGKIVYVGNYITLALLKDALKYGIGALIGGSADLETFRYALRSNISLGLFSGFGDIETPDEVYSVLNNVFNRYVFFQGEKTRIRIPMPPQQEVATLAPKYKSPVEPVIQGARVLVLQNPYFGKTGIVDSVGESSIFVKFSLNKNPVEVRLPNFFLLNNI